MQLRLAARRIVLSQQPNVHNDVAGRTMGLPKAELQPLADCMAKFGVVSRPMPNRPCLNLGHIHVPDLLCQLLLLQKEASRSESHAVAAAFMPKMHGLLAYLGTWLEVRLPNLSQIAVTQSFQEPHVHTAIGSSNPLHVPLDDKR